MPTYQYECLSCGKIFDFFQKMTEKPLEKCICCKKGRVKRMIGTGAGIIFKGSGFYETDYKRKSQSTTEHKKDTTEKKETKTNSASDTKTTEKKK